MASISELRLPVYTEFDYEGKKAFYKAELIKRNEGWVRKAIRRNLSIKYHLEHPTQMRVQ